MFTPTYYLTVFTVAIGASTQFYSFGIVNPVQTIIMEWINTTYWERYDYPLNLTQLNVLWSFVVSSIAVGAIIGALLTRVLADKCGRRNALIINGMINVLGGILELVSKNFSSPELLMLGRTILGFNMGLGSGLVPMYLMEITPARFRGAAGTVHQVAVAFGDWFSLFMGLPIAFGTERYWPVAFAFPGFLALILCIILPFCPESPKYNLLCGGEFAQIADHDVRRLIKTEEDAREFSHDIRLEIPTGTEEQEVASYADFFKKPPLRRAMIAAIFVMIAQQFTGCTAVFAYSTDMFMNAKLSLDMARYSTLGIGIMYFLCASLSPFLIDRVGRKGLSLFQLSSCLLALIMLSVFTYLQQSAAFDWARYGSVFALVFFMCVYGVGSPIPWMITSELFTTKYRSAAVTITVSVAWFLAFALSTAYLPFQQLVGVSCSYLPFIVVVSISICVMYNILPETKDRSAIEINHEIRSRIRSVMSGAGGESENLPLLGDELDEELDVMDDMEDAKSVRSARSTASTTTSRSIRSRNFSYHQYLSVPN
uniref:MFS domain-containing protein n=1 Tax=Steinernema glaseri TaxID=37863 RepID=A0A1I7YPD3_9BILA